MAEKRYYDCEACIDKNCSICPNCGKNTAMRDYTDSYRQNLGKRNGNGIARGYYTTSFVERFDEEGNSLGYVYHKPGD